MVEAFPTCHVEGPEFAIYLFSCGFGVLTLLKATAALVWGAEDIISTAFAEVGTTTESGKSFRIGLTFTLIGAGCFLGPTTANLVTDTWKPNTLLLACIAAMGFQLTSWLGMWQSHDNFGAFLCFTLLRATGSSIIWVNSTLLLQTLSAEHQLGKVLAVEYFTYTLAESLAAWTAGRLEDADVSKNEIALVAAGIATGAIVVWSWQVFVARGAGNAFTADREWGPVESDDQCERHVKGPPDGASDGTDTVATSESGNEGDLI